MKIPWLTGIFVFLQITVGAQANLPVYPDSLFSTYYQQRVTHFKTLPKTTGDIIFLGNSITNGAEWSELFEDDHIKNRIHTAFCNENGLMRAGLTNDGLHLKGQGYLLWKHLIYPIWLSAGSGIRVYY